MTEPLYVPTPDDFDDADARDMRAACVGTDLSGQPASGMLRFAAMPGIKSSSREGATVFLICGHTAEGARTARSLAAYFARSDVMASSHVAIDATETLHLVSYDRAAWTLRSGNPYSDNAEICGFARWSRAQWLSAGTVDGCVNPRAMVDRFAAWVKARCEARGISVRRLTLAQVRARTPGVIHHDDWTKAMNDGTHWDCGPGFPWDYVLAKAQEDDMPLTDADVNKVWDEKAKNLRTGDFEPLRALVQYAHANAYDAEMAAKKAVAELAEVRAELAANKQTLAEILAAVKEA